MSAEMALQAAVVAALREALGDDVSGVFDGVPAGASYPLVSIEEGSIGDWSTKTAAGREHRLALAVRDDGASAARLHGLADRAVAAIEGLDPALDGWLIASCVFVRSRTVRTAAGPWAALIEFRVRTMAM